MTSLEERFWDFHNQNPKVYEELIKLTRQAHSKGRRKIGMQMLFEVIRWNKILQTTDDDFKLNNDYAAYYSRLIMKEHPEFKNMFETRKVRGDYQKDTNQKVVAELTKKRIQREPEAMSWL
jgi:hypothetical protein